MIKILFLFLFAFFLLNAQAQVRGGSLQQTTTRPPVSSPPAPAPLPPHGSSQPGHPRPAAAHPALIKRISLREDQLDLDFPLITMADPAVSKKINAYLQNDLLQQDTVRRTAKHLFDMVKFVFPGGGMDELDYTVLLNSPKLLSLEFNGSNTGAYPTPFEEYFQFYTRTGEPVLLEEIMTPEGMLELGKDLIRKRKILIAVHLEELKKDTDAVKWLDEIAPRLAEGNEEADSDRFSIRPTGLHFHKGQNLSHAMLGWDADLDIDYTFRQFSPWLSDFGKKLLLKP